MDHAEKLRLMLEDLPARGVSAWTAAPPVYRLAWKLGLNLAPPLFASFGALFLFQGVFFGLLWGVFFNFFLARNLPLGFRLGGAVAAGVLFGLIMAFVIRGMARKHRLPAWEDYRGAVEAPPRPPTGPRA